MQIGTFTKGNNGHPDLVVTFNSNATAAAVSGLLQSITFRAHKFTGVVRTIDFQVTNIEGVDSDVGEVNVTVTPRFRKSTGFFRTAVTTTTTVQ